MTLEQLAVDHAYYCSDSNYYSNDASATFDTWDDFMAEMGESDLDYNLCFRFDIHKTDKEDDTNSELSDYHASIFMMQQRKGKFVPILINEIKESDAKSIINWLTPRWRYLKKLWEPFS